MGSIKKGLGSDQQEKFAAHLSSPFVWIETSDGKHALGGRDRFSEWAAEKYAGNDNIQKELKSPSFFEAKVDTTPGTLNA